MGILRDRMIDEMKLQTFSLPTKKSYLYAVTRITKHYRRSPVQLDKEQIGSYLTVERKLFPNTMMGQIAGLRFNPFRILGQINYPKAAGTRPAQLGRQESSHCGCGAARSVRLARHNNSRCVKGARVRKPLPHSDRAELPRQVLKRRNNGVVSFA